MKTIILSALLFWVSTFSLAQNVKISSIDHVQVLNNNLEEAVYYYQNNWKVLREMALEKDYIDSFQFLENTDANNSTDSTDIILITTFGDSVQFSKREKHFEELISIKGPLQLMNDKKPGEFRKTLKSQDFVNR
ncbi:MAG: hypothetical protein AAF363_15510 [Bacteroidota bacterium]